MGLTMNRMQTSAAAEANGVKAMQTLGSDGDPHEAIASKFARMFSDPNGALYMTALQTDLDYFKQLGLVKKDVTLTRVIDRSFAEAAAAQLGPYKK